MRLHHWIASVLVAVGVAACNQNSRPESQPASAKATGASSPLAQSPPFSKNAAPPHLATAGSPVPPADAQWTILCDSVEGPAHVEDAALLKSRLIKLSRMSDWYVVHEERQSTLYYGYYRSMDNPAEKLRAERDRSRIATLTDRLGNRLVRGGVLVPVTLPDPQAPPDWNLLNAPPDAYWTLEIAVFLGNPHRKEAAVQAVRELRAKGEQAYYYHGPSVSSVCLGAWPREAIKEQGTGIDAKGEVRDDAHTSDPTQPLLVFADKPPPNLPSRIVDPATGRPMSVQALKLEYQDPILKQKVAQYPYHFVNYELRGLNNGSEVRPDSSVLCVIPRDRVAGQEDWRLTGGSPANATQDLGHGGTGTDLGRPSSVSPGDDALRSIGGSR